MQHLNGEGQEKSEIFIDYFFWTLEMTQEIWENEMQAAFLNSVILLDWKRM